MIDKIISWINIWLQSSGMAIEFPRLPASRNAYVIIQIKSSKKIQANKERTKKLGHNNIRPPIWRDNMTLIGHFVTNLMGYDPSNYLHPKTAYKHAWRPQFPNQGCTLPKLFPFYKLD